MLRPLQRMPASAASRCVERAHRHAVAADSVDYPDWYLKRWHCLPEGYLSERSIQLYDVVIRRLYSVGRENDVAYRIARLCGRTGAKRLLAIGCGSGSLEARVARLVPGLRISGMDLSPFAVARARERLPTARIVHGDAQRMPWPDDSFDVVLASHLLGHVPPAVRDRIAAEAFRVLTGNGQLVVVDHRWHDAGLPGFRRIREWTSGAGMVRIACHVPAATVSVAK